MNRKVLLVEPNYKNKYPPMGLMKLATYYRESGDDVRFFKGDLLDLAADIVVEDLLNALATLDAETNWKTDKKILVECVRKGTISLLDEQAHFQNNSDAIELVKNARSSYRKKEYFKNPPFDKVGITTLFTFYWNITIDTINFVKQLCKKPEDVMVGGIMSTLLPNEVYEATGIHPFEGRKEQIERARDRFGEQRDLLLLDNNVLASKCYDRIIDEIKACGFQKGATYMPPNQYEIAIQNLKDGYNDRAYVRKCIRLYKELTEKLPLEEKTELYLRLEQAACLHYETATKEEILKLDEFVAPLFKKHFKHTKKVKRIVDFNQGIDARLINDQNMAKLAEINISPLRIAFDHWEQKDIYEKAVRTAVAHGITNLSNYMLYNFRDKPEHLYYRMKLNVDLCDELGANIYSFPMKYHPINDPDFFMNRDYIGEHWNRKFIRAIQAVLNSTKGKVGKGKHFFEEAFGADEHRFWTILWMPETFIIYRFMFKENLAKEWEEKFWSLSSEELKKVKSVVAVNKFKDLDFSKYSKEARDVLQYYMVTRDEAEQMLKEKNS